MSCTIPTPAEPSAFAGITQQMSTSMIVRLHSVLIALALALAAATRAAGDGAKPHRVAIQIDQNDEAVMNMVLNNAKNVLEHYRAKNEDAEVEIVAYGPGLDMLRDDKR